MIHKSKLPFFKTAALFFGFSLTALANTSDLDLKFAGALEFSESGTLFVGDNHNGAVYAFDLSTKDVPEKINPIYLGDIDTKMANMLGVGPGAIAINDLAAHPLTGDIYISLTRITNFGSKPVIMRITQDAEIEPVNLASKSFQKQELSHYPTLETTFRPRSGGMGDMISAKDLAKGDIKLTSLAIMDMRFHKNELFVSGVSSDNFLSTLRRISFPFDDNQSTANVEMYHIAHDQFETRAPIRAMAIHEIDGKDHLIAAYTCSPLVIVPLDEIVDGAKISARTIGDMGNGQPIDMLSYKLMGQDTLFVTSNSRSPQIIPVAGLSGAKAVTDKDFERGGKLDFHPLMPYGPVGKSVMFDGMSLHIDVLGDKLFVSITRDAISGSLNLDSNPSIFPNRIHNLIAEYDFPQYHDEKKSQ